MVTGLNFGPPVTAWATPNLGMWSAADTALPATKWGIRAIAPGNFQKYVSRLDTSYNNFAPRMLAG